MKKLLLFVLALVMLGVPFTVFAEDGETPLSSEGIYSQGDVDANNNINIKDATITQKFLVKLQDFSNSQQKRANVDGENPLNIKDVTFLQKFIAKLEPELYEPRNFHQGAQDDDVIITLPIIPAM